MEYIKSFVLWGGLTFLLAVGMYTIVSYFIPLGAGGYKIMGFMSVANGIMLSIKDAEFKKIWGL